MALATPTCAGEVHAVDMQCTMVSTPNLLKGFIQLMFRIAAGINEAS